MAGATGRAASVWRHMIVLAIMPVAWAAGLNRQTDLIAACQQVGNELFCYPLLL